MVKLKSFLIRNNIVGNIFGLGIVKMLNIIITFATLPYLLRVMGAEKWGEVVFVQLLINYMVWFVNWGFYYGATRRISQKRDSLKERTLLFSEAWFAQLILSIFVLFFFLMTIFFMPLDFDIKILYFSSIGLIVGNFLTPLWYLNGLELVKESEFMLFLNKLLVLPFIYLFVLSDRDAYLYLLLNSLSSVIVGIYCIYWLKKRDLFSIVNPKLQRIYGVVSSDFIFFANGFLYTLNSSIVPFFLGASSNMSELGYYNLAERVRGVAGTCLQPVTHALFPRMCYLFSTNTKAAQKMLIISGGGISCCALLISLVMFCFSSEIVVLMGGGDYNDSVYVLKIMSFSAFFVTLSSFITDQVIIPNNWQKIISYAILISSVFMFILVYPIVSDFGSSGGAWLFLLSQVLVVFIMLVFLFFKNKR
ncbi:oligosaccharide flippase family protein [Marinomonas posidonica]|uniref:Polysaccharide biosynthesis protein n=1 Tax=Marinomonas posidonica (strain CECT 7376 / NCIMB 14433 / IVIA-Po-181) TaxID=491952 RepID=F6CZN9_MARPP|nr:oligosaccharide flippase family protein [Marinomonas posidonica]AEF53550.1 polysaccharide biosynthesis protein [Marinomonas posidonica IVIA-Po-181]